MRLKMTEKPERKLKDGTIIAAYCVQLFLELSRPEQMRIIRIMETMNEKKEETQNGKD